MPLKLWKTLTKSFHRHLMRHFTVLYREKPASLKTATIHLLNELLFYLFFFSFKECFVANKL